MKSVILLSKNFRSIGVFLTFALACFSSLLSSQAAIGPSDDCSTIDLNAAEDSPFRQIPIDDQDGSNTCYAHTSATMVNYWRIKHGGSPTDLINPVYASWLNHYGARTENEKDNATNSGLTHEVIADLKTQGYCSNQQVHACLSTYQDALGMSDAELLYFLETIYQNYEVTFHDDAFSDSTQQQVMKHIAELTLKKKVFQGKECEINTFMETKDALNIMGEAATSVLADLFKACTPKKSLSEIPNPHFYFEAHNNNDVKNKIDATLNQKMPLSIDFCSQFLDTPAYRGLKNEDNGESIRGYKINLKSDCGEHAAVVSARENFSGSCKYLIRNSWGALWHPKGMDCACIETDGTYESICKQANPREFVGCWYNKNDLIPNAYGVTAF